MRANDFHAAWLNRPCRTCDAPPGEPCLGGRTHVLRRNCGKASPMFSDEDGDLAGRYWQYLNGYAVGKLYPGAGAKRRHILAHRAVMSRLLGRPLGPAELVDHIDGDPLNNRRENLRLTDRRGNAQHVPARSGLRGASLHAGGRWVARVGHEGKTLHLGLYDTPEEAARVAAAKRAELGFLGEAP